ncbi:MAG: hypothetical protein M3016_07660 [Actinomycetota bacterium]|nr:hypothetical protein [Actinomycetota bacterium]
MILALVLAVTKVDDVSAAGPLTLIFPLVLVFVVAGLWAVSFRRFGRGGQ